MDKEAERIRHTPNALMNYEIAMNHLYTSGVLSFVKSKGRPQLMQKGKNTQESTSIEGAFSAGWFSALETLENFQELFIATNAPKEVPRADFSATRTLLENKDITQEEADAIRRNRS